MPTEITSYIIKWGSLEISRPTPDEILIMLLVLLLMAFFIVYKIMKLRE